MRRYAVRTVDRSYLRENFNCSTGCHVGTKAGAYVQEILFGDYEKAYAIARGPNPFASICGRVCAHPCEGVCRKGLVEKDPISIRALKRFATERYGVEARPVFAIGETLRYSTAPGSLDPSRSGKRVAIIGSGPAGLTCAHDLARLGHACTIFEAQTVAGGMLILGIPEYRLPRELVKREIDAILSTGTEIRYGARLGRDFLLQDLRQQGFDAVFLGIGAHRSHGLDIPGMDLDGVISGVDFLLNANLGYKVDLGKKVIVIGGGNVAVDVARTVMRVGDEKAFPKADGVSEARQHIDAALDVARSALRLGAREVTMVCLESREEMPAWEWEIEEGLREGVDLQPSRAPKRVLGREGKVIGLETLAVRALRDEQGRFRPTFQEGSEATLEADTVLYAIGQAPDLSWIREPDGIEVTARGLVRVERETLATTAAGVYAGGDVAFGPRLIIEAVADGQRAARSIARYLGEGAGVRTAWRSIAIRHRMADDFDRTPRQKPPVIDVARRTGITEVESCYDEAAARTEGSRCYRCNVNTIISSTKCILCGGCVDVCPESCYRLVDVAQLRGGESLRAILRARFGTDMPSGSAIIKDETRCTRCGLCEKRCPTHAITMELFVESEVPA